MPAAFPCPLSSCAPNPTRCPLCNAPNRCAMEIERETGVPQGACWCTQVRFEPTLLERVPPESRGQACICQACAIAPPPLP